MRKEKLNKLTFIPALRFYATNSTLLPLSPDLTYIRLVILKRGAKVLLLLSEELRLRF